MHLPIIAIEDRYAIEKPTQTASINTQTALSYSVEISWAVTGNSELASVHATDRPHRKENLYGFWQFSGDTTVR